MKKTLLTLFALGTVLCLFFCSEDTGGLGSGDILVTINADLSTQLLVRGPGDGDAGEIDRYTLLVYKDGVTTPCQTTSSEKSFTLRLDGGHDYVFAIWADCSEGPYTIDDNDGTVSIDPSGFETNNEKFDAFFGTVSITNIQSNVEKSVVLKRPSGQLNIKADDYQASVDAGFTPDNITVRLSDVYTKFDMLTGEVSEQEDIECSAAVTGEVLSFSYLFAPDTNDYTVDVSATVSFETGSPRGFDVPEVPVKRNYRTTIEGDILTQASSFSISIDPEFEDTEIIGIPVRISGVNKSFPTINAALEYLKTEIIAGAKIIVTGGTYNEDILLPAGVTLQGVGASTVLTGYMILNEGVTIKNFKHVWAAPATPRTAVYIGGSNVTLENIELEGKPGKDKAEAIVTEVNASGFKVKNCKFSGYWKGIYLNTCVGLRITGSEFVNMNPFSTDKFDGSMTVTGNTFRRQDGDWQQPHLIVTNADAPNGYALGWSSGLKTVVNQIINDNTWVGSERMRVQCTAGTTFDVRITAAIAINNYNLASLISGASAGATIDLDPYTNYEGQVTIDKDITLIGGEGTIISAVSAPDVTLPAPGIKQGLNPVMIITGGNVTLKNVTITANGTPANNGVDGITVLDDATLNLDGVTFDGITNLGGPWGAQYGRCVTVYGSGSVLNVNNCIFKDFNKNAIHMMTGEAKVSNSQFTGYANGEAKGLAAQNGVVFVGDSFGSVRNCSFTDFNYDGVEATGVLIWTTGTVADDGGNTYVNCDNNWYIEP